MKIPEIPLPPYVDPEAWQAYMEIRVKKKYTMTDRAIKMLLNKLADFDRIGYSREQITESIDRSYSGGWHSIAAGPIPIVVMVREGSVIPHIELAQSTLYMNWSELDLIVYATDSEKAKGQICLPSDQVLRSLSLVKKEGEFKLEKDPFSGRVTWHVKGYDE